MARGTWGAYNQEPTAVSGCWASREAHSRGERGDARERGGGGASLGHGWGPRGLGLQEAPLLDSCLSVSLGRTCSSQGCLPFGRESPGPRFPRQLPEENPRLSQNVYEMK